MGLFDPSTSPIPTPMNGTPTARRVGRAVSSPLIETGYMRQVHRTSDLSSNGREMLFAHDRSRVISFNSIGNSVPPSSSPIGSSASAPNTPRGSPQPEQQAQLDKQTIGTLPWTSRTERLIASGRLQLYRVHTVAFLNAGDIIHPILAKSQCWCVDGESTFVLRVRGNTYYRIELPNGDDDQAGKLKEVLSKILLYEKTPCPFQRGFTVELPPPPSMPVIKRRWRPPERPKTAPSLTENSEDAVGSSTPTSIMMDRSQGSNTGSVASDWTPTPSPGSTGVVLATDNFIRSPAQWNFSPVTRSVTVPTKFYLKAATATVTPSPAPPVEEATPSTRTNSHSSTSVSSVLELVDSPSFPHDSVKSRSTSRPSTPEVSPRKWHAVFPREDDKEDKKGIENEENEEVGEEERYDDKVEEEEEEEEGKVGEKILHDDDNNNDDEDDGDERKEDPDTPSSVLQARKLDFMTPQPDLTTPSPRDLQTPPTLPSTPLLIFGILSVLFVVVFPKESFILCGVGIFCAYLLSLGNK
ncbi:MAG: hypothetical protein M1823_005000 [Watsoniomyces obsoletus]|nr:MAG: hypothetical protein M1823_005000 [Watsoniomyces obsoletus]